MSVDGEKLTNLRKVNMIWANCKLVTIDIGASPAVELWSSTYLISLLSFWKTSWHLGGIISLRSCLFLLYRNLWPNCCVVVCITGFSETLLVDLLQLALSNWYDAVARTACYIFYAMSLWWRRRMRYKLGVKYFM